MSFASRSCLGRLEADSSACRIGDRLEVELEEADRAEGGSGWLLGRKVAGNGGLGWARTEDFAMLEEDEVDVEGDETTAERVY